MRNIVVGIGAAVLAFAACDAGHADKPRADADPSAGADAAPDLRGGEGGTAPNGSTQTGASGFVDDATTQAGAPQGGNGRPSGGEAGNPSGGDGGTDAEPALGVGLGTSGAGGNECAAGELRPWATWPMPTPPSLDLAHARNFSVTGVAGARLVTDRVTGLEWQGDVSADALDWSNAKGYCESSQYAGYCGWRLPSRIELASLVDNSKPLGKPMLDVTAFGKDAPPAIFWSASPSADFYGGAWVVDFHYGLMFPLTNTADPRRVRCVRGVDSEEDGARYEVGTGALAGTVLDRGTGLRWERDYVSIDAKLGASTCAAKTFAGFDDYRLPTVIELATLVDEKRYDPAIDTELFGSVPQLYDYFMAREFAGAEWGDGTGNWVIDFRTGASSIAGGPLLLRCVRNE